jgi:hypothetical protein
LFSSKPKVARPWVLAFYAAFLDLTSLGLPFAKFSSQSLTAALSVLAAATRSACVSGFADGFCFVGRRFRGRNSRNGCTYALLDESFFESNSPYFLGIRR